MIILIIGVLYVLKKIKVVPYPAIIQFFLEKNIIILHGTRCCKNHLLNKHFKKNISFPNETIAETYMTAEEISDFLKQISVEANKSTRLWSKGKLIL